MPPQKPPSIRELLAKAAADTKRLANAQIALAKAELSASGQRFGKGAVFGIATLGIIFFATMFLLLTLALVLVQLGLPPWAGFLIVTALLILGALVTGLLARSAFSRISGPSLAMTELDRTKAALSGPAALDLDAELPSDPDRPTGS